MPEKIVSSIEGEQRFVFGDFHFQRHVWLGGSQAHVDLRYSKDDYFRNPDFFAFCVDRQNRSRLKLRKRVSDSFSLDMTLKPVEGLYQMSSCGVVAGLGGVDYYLGLDLGERHCHFQVFDAETGEMLTQPGDLDYDGWRLTFPSNTEVELVSDDGWLLLLKDEDASVGVTSAQLGESWRIGETVEAAMLVRALFKTSQELVLGREAAKEACDLIKSAAKTSFKREPLIL